jgi:hypothetical protein
VAAAYNGAELLRQRRGLADRWARYCTGAEVIDLSSRRA